MAQVRWSALARRDLAALQEWLTLHWGVDAAASASLAITEALGRAAQHPELYAWVGSVRATLSSMPRSVRRIVIARYGIVAFYDWQPDQDRVYVVRLRGGRQRPPSAQDLTPLQ